MKDRIVVRVALINDTSTSRNQGCQVTMHMVNRAVEQVYAGARVERVYLTAINHPFRRREARRSLAMRPGDLDRCLRYVERYRPAPFDAIGRALDGADVVVINGEGSMIEHQPNARLIYTIIEMAFRRGIPAHLINFTAHVTQELSIEWAAFGFGRCASVSVREPLSYDVVRPFHPSVKLFPDMAVALDIQTGERVAPCLLIGSGSAATRIEKDAARTARLRETYHELCRQLAQEVPIRLMGWHRDEWLRELAGPGVAYHDVDFVRYASLCRDALLNFTGRHHGCVMSVAAGCPFLTTTANCFKNYGDALLYGSVGPVLEMEQLAAGEAAELIRAALREAPEQRRRTERRRDELIPFAFGAVENTVTPRPDLVDAGLVQPFGNRPLEYVQHEAA